MFDDSVVVPFAPWMSEVAHCSSSAAAAAAGCCCCCKYYAYTTTTTSVPLPPTYYRVGATILKPMWCGSDDAVPPLCLHSLCLCVSIVCVHSACVSVSPSAPRPLLALPLTRRDDVTGLRCAARALGAEGAEQVAARHPASCGGYGSDG